MKTLYVKIMIAVMFAVTLTAMVSTGLYYSGSNRHNLPVSFLADRRVKLTYSFVVNNIPRGTETVRAWVPLPPTDEHQKVQSFIVTSDWKYTVEKENQYHNKFLVFDLDKAVNLAKGPVEISIVFDVTRIADTSLSDGINPIMLIHSDRVRYLSPDKLVPINGKIAEEAQQTVGLTSEPLAQARLLFDNIVDTVNYDKSGKGWGRGDAIYACNVRRGNCSDFHSLFIGQARSLGIPARFVMGLPIPEDKTQGEIPGYHCWAEFYTKEKGWLGVDASEARKFPGKKNMYFGNLDSNRVAFTVGRDIKLPGSKAEPVNFSIYPHVEVDGRIHTDVQTKFYFKDIKGEKPKIIKYSKVEEGRI